MTETELAGRLERLERDNRRLKGFALGVLTLAAALSAIYATQPVPDVIKAHSFVAVDSFGKPRATVDASDGVQVYDLEGKLLAMMEIGPFGEPFIELNDPESKASTIMELTQSRSIISLQGAKGVGRAAIFVGPSTGPGITLRDSEDNDRALIGVSPEGKPSIELADPEGFSMDLGVTGTITPTTGETHKTSAASITMFGNDKDHHVIWKAP
ncbi:MAG: hypothetical protein ACREU2_12220 [Steroidobacteraceae bacterium]